MTKYQCPEQIKKVLQAKKEKKMEYRVKGLKNSSHKRKTKWSITGTICLILLVAGEMQMKNHDKIPTYLPQWQN